MNGSTGIEVITENRVTGNSHLGRLTHITFLLAVLTETGRKKVECQVDQKQINKQAFICKTCIRKSRKL